MKPPIDLTAYKQIVVLTGAGVSAGSGLPTYRGKGGLWTTSNVEQYATAAAIAADPARVWEFFAPIRVQIDQAQPNAAHRALADAETRLGSGQQLVVITQNVDGLHLLAGSRHVVELHGALRRTRCTKCDFVQALDLAASPLACPACPLCTSALRPDVILFDEAISVDAEWASKKALRSCDLFLAVGTSGTVSPASNFVRSAEYAGARTVYVNLEPMSPSNPAFQETHLGPAEVVLPQLLGCASD